MYQRGKQTILIRFESALSVHMFVGPPVFSLIFVTLTAPSCVEKRGGGGGGGGIS